MSIRIARTEPERYVGTMNTRKSIEVSIEVESGAFVKRRPDGSVDFFSPFPSPFAYGCVVGSLAPDGDPEDALVIGRRPSRGTRVQFPVWGQVLFWDAGVEDHKWVVGPEPLTEREWARIERFFGVYAFTKRALYAIRRVSGGAVFGGVRRHPVSLGY